MDRMMFRFDLQRFADGSGNEGSSADVGGASNPQAPADANQTGGEGSQEGGAGSLLGNAVSEQTGDSGDGANDTGKEPPATYDFSSVVPEGMEYDANAADAFAEFARKEGFSQEQASSLAAYGMQYMQQNILQIQQQEQAMLDTMREDTVKELGKDLDDYMASARTACDRLEKTVPGLKEMLNNPYIGNNATMIRLFAAVGKLIGEDGGHTGSSGGGEKSIYDNTDFRLYK